MANDFLDPIVQKVTNNKSETFDNLVKYIGTDVYGSQMRVHLKQSIDTLGRAATELNDQGGSGGSGGSGVGWTNEQINQLGKILNAAGYAETGIGEEINKLLASLHGEKTLMSWTVSPETINVPAGASLDSNSVRKMLTVTATITDGLGDWTETIADFTLTGTLIHNSACPVTLSFNYNGTTYSKTITVNVAARVPVSMSTRWFGHDEGYVLPVYLGTSAEHLKDGIVATLLYSDGYTEQTTDMSVSGDISYRIDSPITVVYNKMPAITSVIYAYKEMNVIASSASVLYLLEGCAATNTQPYAQEGEAYSTTISAKSGNVNSIKVLIDGVDWSERVVSVNNITIPGENVMAGSNIIIIAENTAAFSVSYHLSNCRSTSTVTTIAKGTSYLTEIQPDPGYTIDASQTKAIMNGDEYSYSESSRTITILNVQGNIDVYGVATASEVPTHTVTFVADGVTVGTVTFAEGDTSVAEPDVPPKEHYTGAWQTYSLGTTDLTVEAIYTPVTYTITFVDDGGNHPVTYTVLTADTVSAPTVTPREGYTAAWPSWSVEYDNNQTVEAVYTPSTLTSITATYSGGTVAAGTTLDQLTGITVTATYSDGSTATVAPGDYILSGTLTAGQSNTVTVTYQGKTATFTVTVEEESSAVTGESTTATCAGVDSSTSNYIPFSGKTLTFADALTLQPTKIVITTNPEDRKAANLNIINATIIYADGSWSLTEGVDSTGSSADGGADMTQWTTTINIAFTTDSDGKYIGIGRLDMARGSGAYRWRSAYYQFAIYSGDQAV